MLNSKQKEAAFGLLVSVIALSFLAVLQLATASSLAYAQTGTYTITGTCELDISDSGVYYSRIYFRIENVDFTYPNVARILDADGNVVFQNLIGFFSNGFEFSVGVRLSEQYTIEHYQDIDRDQVRYEPGELVGSYTVECPQPMPSTPAEATTELISDIESLGDDVPQGTKTSIAAPLKEASDILTDDNPNNDKSACGKLDASIRQIDASERRGTLTEEQANNLRTQATDIRTELDC